ncbi:unnamed protein product [Arctia plantaginis]|uniref:Uncharacterized protein n=1 Tax=Arctia plantaginis TaxID=874455 RepID=A0A8S1AA39_ARCPL|nr:unnamed protein product [Arctia plantaginis]
MVYRRPDRVKLVAGWLHHQSQTNVQRSNCNLDIMLKLRDKEVDVEEFGLEYIKHAALVKHPYRRNKLQYKRVVAYNELAQRFGVSAWQARSLEQLFRSYVCDKMERLVRDGLRYVAELPQELSWLALVEENFQLLPKLLQDCGDVEREPHELVLSALCTQVLLRGSLSDSAMFDTVRRTWRLAVTNYDLEAAWERGQRLALESLERCSRAGDAPAEALPAWLARVADVVLLYTDLDTHRLLADESEQLYEEAEALSVLWQLVQRHRVEERAPRRSGVRAQRWSRALREYCAAGRCASLVVLQRRWHELKLRTRYKLVNYWRTTSECHAASKTSTPACSDPPREINIAILKRYPHIVTSPLPSWRQLVDMGLIITRPVDDDIKNLERDSDKSMMTRKRTAEQGSYCRGRNERSPPRTKLMKPEPDEEPRIRDTYSSNVPCAIKPELNGTQAADFNSILKNIKTEVDDVTENHPYQVALVEHNDLPTNGTDFDARKIEIDICVKEEPIERVSKCPIVFSDEDQDNDGLDAESSDDDVDTFDNKLLLDPYVELTRIDVASLLNHESESEEHGYVEVDPMVKVELEEPEYAEEAKIKLEMNDDTEAAPRSTDEDARACYVAARGPRRSGRRSKAQRSLALPHQLPHQLPHNNKLYILQRVEPAALEINDLIAPAVTKASVPVDGAPKEPETLTLRQLNLLLNELTDVAMVNHLLRRSQRTCCAARKHSDISAARQRMGLPPLPRHTHADGAACTCCCAESTRLHRPALDAELQALSRDFAAMTAPPQLAHRH